MPVSAEIPPVPSEEDFNAQVAELEYVLEPSDYLSALRRRSWVLVVAAVVAAAVTIVVTPSSAERDRAQRRLTAEHIVALPPSPDIGDAKANAARGAVIGASSRLFGTREVARRAAAALERPDPDAVRKRVTISSNKKQGTITFSTTGRDADAVVLLVDTYAEVAMAYQSELATQAYESELERTSELVTAVSEELAAIDVELKATEGANPSLKARRDALAAQITSLAARHADLAIKGPPAPRFVTLVKAEAVETNTGDEADKGFGAPESRRGRLVLAILLALVVGGAVVLVLDRFDSRLYTKPAAEASFGLPVLTEVPATRRRPWRRATGKTSADRLPTVAEAYRKLRSAIVLAQAVPRLRPVSAGATPTEDVNKAAGAPASHDYAYELRMEPLRNAAEDVRLIIVASPRRGEGRSTTAMNLALSFAEAGRSVLVVDADLRRPSLDSYFAVDPAPGLSDIADAALGSYELTDMARPTSHPQVRLVSSGARSSNPARAITSARRVLERARASTDVIVVDTPPALLFNDAAELVPAADAVVVVARSGRTTVDDARRMSELLARLGAPAFGIALIGTRRHRESVIRRRRRGRRTFSAFGVTPDAAVPSRNGLSTPDAAPDPTILPPAPADAYDTRSPARSSVAEATRVSTLGRRSRRRARLRRSR